MIDIKHILKVASAWTSIVYTVCYAVIAVWPSARIMTMRYALHADISLVSNYFGFGYFILGLIFWNLIALIAVWLFAFLFNTIKK